MVTSRTGTTKWLRLRQRVIRRAKLDGVERCPGYGGHACGRELDYQSHGEPSSVEVDHIIPAAEGGPDTDNNTRVLCRACNQSRGDGRKAGEVDSSATPMSPEWNAEQFPLDAEWLDKVLPVTEP